MSYNQKSTDEKGVLVGMAIGALLGVAVGLLYAPQSGVKTRKNIKDSVRKASHGAHTLKKTVASQAGDVQQKVQKVAKQAASEIEQTARENIENARAKTLEVKDTVIETATLHAERATDAALQKTGQTANTIAQAASSARTSLATRRVPKRFKGV